MHLDAFYITTVPSVSLITVLLQQLIKCVYAIARVTLAVLNSHLIISLQWSFFFSIFKHTTDLLF